MKRCITCLYPQSKPDLVFNEAGECSACTNAKNKSFIDWDAREEELKQLLDRFHGDVIVPSSGGKDSYFQAIRLKEMGANVTTVNARTCHLTKIGRDNLDNLAKHVHGVEYVPNMTVRAKLNRLGLSMVGDISWPEHAAIFSTPFRASIELGIPLIMYGECPQNEYGGPQGSEQAKTMTYRWISEFGGFLGLRPDDFVGMEGITARDMEDYKLPQGLDKTRTEAHFIGQYIEWDSHHNARIAKEHGMKYMLPADCNWWEFENQDNLDTFWHDHAMYRKYGYGRLTAQISVDIRRGKISRQEAEKIMRKREGLVPDLYIGHSIYDSIERIGLTKEKIWKIMDQFTSWDLFRRVDDDQYAEPILVE